MGKRISKWFRELKSEFKKIVWPSRKQLINNTGVVLVVVLIAAAFIALIDYLFKAAILDGLLVLITGY
ncbi:MAG: preprotein translocase subunit SecE [Clostridiales bacterium]|nr:preprotein translocase subunit SecE [Clostridiales bacterium]